MNPTPRPRPRRVVYLLALGAALIGCALIVLSRLSQDDSGLLPEQIARARRAPPHPTATQTPPELLPILVSASELPPATSLPDLPTAVAVETNPGIVVWEPVCSTGNGELAAFGAGCARWLDWAVTGLPEMGRSCAFTSAQRVAAEMGRSDLRLTGEDAVTGGRRLGVTHVVVGEITGGSGKLTLRLRILSTSTAKEIGAEISASGSPTQIVNRLPGLARQIAAHVGAPSAETPKSVGVSSEVVTAYGRLPWRLTDRVPLTVIRDYESIGRALPVAAVSVLDAVRWQDPDNLDALAIAASSKAMANVQSVAEVAKQDGYAVPKLRESVAALLRAHPNNYLLVRAEVRLRPTVSVRDMLQVTRRAVTLAPGNPDAWDALAEAVNDVAEDIRRSKVYVDMTPFEREAVSKLYPLAEEATIRAVRLDPQYGLSWRLLAGTAQFNGHDALADDAYWKAVHLDRDDPQLYFWGLQMYQDKWQGGRAKLLRVASIGSQEVFTAPGNARETAGILLRMGYPKEAQPQFERAIAGYKEMASERPNTPWPRLELAATYHDAMRITDAATEYQDLSKRFPKCEAAHVQCGALSLEMHATADAEREFRKAIRLCPQDEWAHGKLGYTLILSKRWKEGEQEVRRGIRADPQWGQGHACLGYSLQMQHKLADAIMQYKAALRLVPTDGVTWDRLTRAYNESGRFKEAVDAGEHGMLYNREYDYAYASLGEAYLGARRDEESAAAFAEYLKRNREDAGCHMLYARALFNLGRDSEAITECNTCIKLMPHSPAAGIARGLLKKHGAS